jgi:CheY-like chemotaxis protein
MRQPGDAQKRILVIDDDEICRRTVVAVLEQSGHILMQADNGEAGVTIALQNPPDLIVTDVVMPKLDGLAVFDILTADPRTQNIPFIFMTGLVEKEGAKRGKRLESKNLLPKPFALVDLIAMVQECLSKSSDGTAS